MVSPTSKNRNRRRLIWVFICALLVVAYIQSPWSKINEIEVLGHSWFDAQLIEKSTGIQLQKNHFFGIRSSKVKQNILSEFPFIQEAKVNRKFPRTIKIELTLKPIVAYELEPIGTRKIIFNDASSWVWNHKISFVDVPILTGWSSADPNKTRLCQVLSELNKEKMLQISEITPAPTVSYPDKILLYTTTQFEVYTTISYLKEKIENLDSYIASVQVNSKAKGIITMLEVDSFAPFP